MSTLPSCTTKNSIIDTDLVQRAKENTVIKLVVVHLDDDGEGYVAGNSYVIVHLLENPQKPFFLATRRDRRRPKVFVDQSRLLKRFVRDFEGIPVQVRLPNM